MLASSQMSGQSFSAYPQPIMPASGYPAQSAYPPMAPVAPQAPVQAPQVTSYTAPTPPPAPVLPAGPSYNAPGWSPPARPVKPKSKGSVR